MHNYQRNVNVKAILSHKVYQAALISASLALSLTPAYTASPTICS